MKLELSRLRAGEWLLGGGAVVLLLSSVMTWYAVRVQLNPGCTELQPGACSQDAWAAMSDVRWLILIVGVLGIGAASAQALCRGPALPVGLAVLELPVSLILVLLLVNRVLISKPGDNSLVSLRAGAAVGLVSSVVVLIAAYRSLREDGIRDADGPQAIETFHRRSRSAPAR